MNSQGQEFLEIRGPVEFLMGSPDNEPRRDGNERQHRRRIDRSIAVGVYEVTAEQFRRFQPDYHSDPEICVTPQCPASFVSWLDTAKYCRWLSEQEKIPEDQMCYPPLDQISLEMVLPANQLLRTGYRLPTEAEWEYFARGGSGPTRYFFGEDERHLSEFGWWLNNSEDRTWPVGLLRPNAFGLFDVEGNLHEWCLPGRQDYPIADSPNGLVDDSLPVLKANPFMFRGATYRSHGRPFRVAFRYFFESDGRYSFLGFRLVRTILAK